MSNESTTAGIGIGSVLAGLISWTLNHSVMWALLHVFLGWFYVIYACCTYAPELEQAIDRVERKAAP